MNEVVNDPKDGLVVESVRMLQSLKLLQKIVYGTCGIILVAFLYNVIAGPNKQILQAIQEGTQVSIQNQADIAKVKKTMGVKE